MGPSQMEDSQKLTKTNEGKQLVLPCYSLLLYDSLEYVSIPGIGRLDSALDEQLYKSKALQMEDRLRHASDGWVYVSDRRSPRPQPKAPDPDRGPCMDKTLDRLL